MPYKLVIWPKPTSVHVSETTDPVTALQTVMRLRTDPKSGFLFHKAECYFIHPDGKEVRQWQLIVD